MAAYGAAKQGYQLAKRLKTTKTMTQRRRRSRTIAPLTSQYDVKTIYRRRPMPKGKKNRYKRFVNKVRNISMKQTNLQSQLISQQNWVEWDVNTCGYLGQLMYTLEGQAGVDGSPTIQAKGNTDHLYRMMYQADLGKQNSNRWHFESCVMDIYIKNPESYKIILEVYEVISRQDAADNTANNSMEEQYETGFAEAQAVNQGIPSGIFNTPYSGFTIGTTPFNNGGFSRNWKVLKKTRVELGGGEVTALQMRDPRNRSFTFNDVKNKVYSPGVTKGYFFQAFGEPGASEFDTVINLKGKLFFTTNTVYNYRITSTNFSRSGATNV